MTLRLIVMVMVMVRVRVMCGTAVRREQPERSSSCEVRVIFGAWVRGRARVMYRAALQGIALTLTLGPHIENDNWAAAAAAAQQRRNQELGLTLTLTLIGIRS